MREVAAKVDFGEIGTAVGDNALEHECGRGGRHRARLVDVSVHVPREDGHWRWEIELREQQIRDIASGLIERSTAIQLAEGTRTQRGDALDRVGRIRRGRAAHVAARRSSTSRSMRCRAIEHVRAAADPSCGHAAISRCVAALNGLDCALYVVASERATDERSAIRRVTIRSSRRPRRRQRSRFRGRISSRGGSRARRSCGSPSTAISASKVILDGSIPTQFLMLGDYDRAAELETRRAPPTDPAQSSLPRRRRTANGRSA